MDPSDFEAAESHLDDLAESIDAALQSPELETLRAQLAGFSETLGQRYGVSLHVIVEVYDNDKDRGLPLLKTGLATSDDGDLCRTWSDTTLQRYITDGEIQVVPHDHCPRCWEEWQVKFRNQQCSSCGAALGRDVKVLLDSDVCPYCEQGRVTMSEPVCDQCGFEVDPALVTWE